MADLYHEQIKRYLLLNQPERRAVAKIYASRAYPDRQDVDELRHAIDFVTGNVLTQMSDAAAEYDEVIKAIETMEALN